MTNHNYDPTQQAKIVIQLIDLIESIRYKRYDQWRDEPHPLGYKFTQRELTQCALPTYGNLLAGRSRRLPARQQVIDVANYLECTIAETNDMLRCAQYLPEYIPLTSHQTETSINRAKQLMSLIPLPAVIMGIGGEGIHINHFFCKLNNLPPIYHWHPEQRNLIHSVFDTTIPSHSLHKTVAGIWNTTAQGAVDLLKSTNKHFRYEPWFIDKLKLWKQLPEFTNFWESTNTACDPYHDTVYAKMQSPYLDEPITEQAVIIPFAENFEVSLIVWKPVDRAAHHVYKEIGCHIDGINIDKLSGSLL